MAAKTSDQWDICLATLRDTDRDRYLACLLSPAEKRGHLAALYAFNAEIARIREVTHQPLAGEIRLQWWRDLLEGQAQGDAGGNPIARCLLETIEHFQLPKQFLLDMLEARTFDLYDDPMPDRSALEGYAGETASAILQMAAMILDHDAARSVTEVAGHAGVAQAIAGSLLLLPFHRRRGQLYIPQDILAATGLDRDTFLACEPRTSCDRAIEAMCALGMDHLGRARKAAPIPGSVISAFLPVANVEAILNMASREGATLLDQPVQLPQWRRQIAMLKCLLLRKI
ncbi:phytoene/squalene synthase family protein [Rhizobium helianthi]|uniref:Phytoene/squalene synthase family protein n=1 Tax=Rhizobium helianthi TaxID=1132695 RepID=A0ABW4M114_9HYPH